MRKYLIAAACIAAALGIVFTGITIFGRQTKAEIIVSPVETYIPGQLVVLDAEKSPGILQWTILPETQNFKIVGKKAYFSSPDATQYTVFISGTSGGTLATKIISLSPAAEQQDQEPLVPEPEPTDPNLIKIKKMIDGGIVTTLDDAILATKQLGIEIPDFKTLTEYKEWIDERS